MGRPKKTLTASAPVSAVTETKVEEEVKEPVIIPLTIDFNREDLKTLGIKVNEIIDYLNEKGR